MTPISRQVQLRKYFMNAEEFVCLFVYLYGCLLVFKFDNHLVYYKKFDSLADHQNHESSCLWLDVLDQDSYNFRKQYTPAAFC